MASQLEQRNEIKELLEQDKEHAYLADCLDLVPDRITDALCAMIWDKTRLKVYKSTIIFQLTQDVAACVGGHPEGAFFSQPYLKTV